MFKYCIRQEICEALEIYQWPKQSTLFLFSLWLGYPYKKVHSTLNELVADGQVEKIQEGKVNKGKPRYIWKLKK